MSFSIIPLIFSPDISVAAITETERSIRRSIRKKLSSESVEERNASTSLITGDTSRYSDNHILVCHGKQYEFHITQHHSTVFQLINAA